MEATFPDLKEAKRCFSRLGSGAFVMLVLGSVLQAVLAGVLSAFLLRSGGGFPPWATWVATFGPLYCVAVPVGLLVMRRAPAFPPPRSALGAGRFLRLLPVCVFLMYAGNLIGTAVTSGLGMLLGSEVENPLLDYAMGGGPFLVKLLVLAVLAPLVEELVFRRALIDRMRVYGEKTAVVTSALMFALFHGNLSQFFYALALGLLFGYVYVKTGWLRYSIALHMLGNLLGSIVAPALLERADLDTLEGLDAAQLAADPAALGALLTPELAAFLLYAAVLALISLLGLILFFTGLKRIEFLEAERELPKEARFRTVWCGAGMILYVVIGLILIVASLFL